MKRNKILYTLQQTNMFIAILVAIVVAAGLGYYFMKTTPVSAAKSDVDAKMMAYLQAAKNDMLYGTSTSEPLFEAFSLRLTEVHQEFGITLIMPVELRDGVGNLPNIDLESLVLTWITCAKTTDIFTCWQNAA